MVCEGNVLEPDAAAFELERKGTRFVLCLVMLQRDAMNCEKEMYKPAAVGFLRPACRGPPCPVGFASSRDI